MSAGSSNGASPLVHVLDDDESVRRALVRLLRVSGHAAEAYGSAAEFLLAPQPDGPECLILDLRIPDTDGLQVLESLRDRESLAVILLSGYGDIETAARAFKLGAVDFLTKPVEDSRLLACVEAALSVSAERYRAAREVRLLRSRFDSLTPRERQVCTLVGLGLLNKQIGHQLGAAEKTVKIHRGRVMSKLEVNSVAELVRFVDRLKLQS